MFTLPRHFFSIFLFGLILVCTLAGALAPAPARADVGIQPILPDGSSIQPDVETPIQMASERVVFNVRQATEWDAADVTYNPMAYSLQNPMIPIWQLSVAEVTADFTMSNPTREAVSMTVWFPLASTLESDEWESHAGEVAPRIENFQVSIAGQPLTYAINELPNPKGTDYPLLPWANFPVTFPPGQDTLIQVSYLIWAQEDISGVGMFLSYIFQTGAGWAGPIGRAELEINLPYLASPETIGMLPVGEVYNGCQVSWTWENFEPGPEDDFSIWLIRQERWEELETARMRVINWPEDGEGYLDLADTYRRLILGKYQILPGFGEIYQPMGVQAAQEAIRHLPGDGRPHYELAMFYLAALPEDPTAEDLGPLLEELRLVAELAPSYEGDVRDWMEFLLSSELWTSLNNGWATQTAVAAALQIPAETPTQMPSRTATPVPSAVLQPYPTPTETASEGIIGNGLSDVILMAAAVIGVVVVGYLVLKRRRFS
jgi:hypothetical protein